jgi:hypothetical protein
MLVPEVLTEDGLQGFENKEDALNSLNKIIYSTRFETAFVVQITDNQRVGEGFRSVEEFNLERGSNSEDYEGF